MCSIKKSYAAFARLLNSGDPAILQESDFHKICSRLHVSASSLDEILIRELGKGGQEIMDEYFGNTGDF